MMAKIILTNVKFIMTKDSQFGTVWS